jgi:hypothetical protein
MTAATMRNDTAGKIRRLAADVQGSHPTMGAHNHLRDAARSLDRGHTEGAQRHIRAAIQMFTPLSLMRHGHLEDEAHTQGKQHMDSAHRMLLLVKDAEDHGYREQDQRAARAAMNAPNTTPVGRPSGTANGPAAPGPMEPNKLPARDWRAAAAQSAGPKLMSNYPQTAADWGGVYAIAIELSAETAALERTPAPRGKPGGPGLYHVKGLGHTPYLQQIVKALIEKRGMAPDKAYAIARGAIRRWMKGGGHVHPEVRAAAAGAEAGEVARQGLAHAHSNDADAIELVGPKGYVHGWIKVNASQGFGAGLQPGSFEHLRAIENLGGLAGSSSGDPAHSSPTMQTALHNLAQSVARRDMASARVHLASAEWGNKHEAGGQWTRDLARLRDQLGHVPKQETGFRQPFYNPVSVRAQHPGQYVSPGGIVANPTQGATVVPSFGIGLSAAQQREILLFNPNHGAGGKFSSAQNAQQGQGKQQGKGKGKGKGQKPGQHHGNAVQRARAKGQLLMTARNDIAKADQLRAQIRALEAQLRGSSPSSAKAGATKASSGATKAASTAAKTPSSTPRKTSGPSASSPAGRAAIASRIGALRSQVHSLMSAARSAQAQAAKL